jgi:hypothetical protein
LHNSLLPFALIVLFVRQHSTDINSPTVIVDGSNQSRLVAANVKNRQLADPISSRNIARNSASEEQLFCFINRNQ